MKTHLREEIRTRREGGGDPGYGNNPDVLLFDQTGLRAAFEAIVRRARELREKPEGSP